jgi:hypothetical protein
LRVELYARYAPQTALDEMEVEHLLNTLWEIQRLVRIKPQVLNMDRKRALADLVKDVVLNHRVVSVESFDKANNIADAYFGSDAERKKVEELLARYGLSSDSITAKAFVLNASTLDGIEEQIQLATIRAYAIRKELETMTNAGQPRMKQRVLTNQRLRHNK